MTDREQREQLQLYLIALTRTWPGIILLVSSVHLIHLSRWFLIPTLLGVAAMLVGLARTHAIVSRRMREFGQEQQRTEEPTDERNRP